MRVVDRDNEKQKRNSEMSSKSSVFSTSSSYGSRSDASDASSLVSLIPSEVEGLMEDLTSRPLVCHPENNSRFDQNFHRETGFSIDADIEPEDAPKCVPRGKSI